MSEAAPVPAKTAKKKQLTKPRTGPGLSDMIVTIVSASKERGGVSGSAIKRALTARGYDVEKNNARVRLAVRTLVLKGTLIQARGTGVSGSFKISKKAAEPKAKKGTKQAAARAKKPATPTKKPATPTKKPAAKKTPKKAKKPAAKKTTKSPKKVTRSPKKVTRSPKKVKAPKKGSKKTTAVKKSPVKRVSKPKTKKTTPKKK
ncbi:histone H1-like [Pagrus major]|uniref:histone H1-like n=1 Tax=Pagrus major TaxID=143350 RepID=UPI003CC85803